MQGADRMKRDIERSSPIFQSARVLQLAGLFDIDIAEKSRHAWSIDLPLDDKPWNVGLIVGPSGCGKSTIARELFGEALVGSFAWDDAKSLVDSFPEDMGIKDITALLSSVGFSSPPSWLKPFGVLSNGEQFRTSIARALCEKRDLCVIDEFTSVVDRTVAKIGSAATAKTVRRQKSKFVAVTCHYDVEDWLDPDWVYDPSIGQFSWRVLRGRPAIELTFYRCDSREWPRFAPHHYLSAQIQKSATHFIAYWQDRPVGFHSFMQFVGSLGGTRKAQRVHRSVVLPDFQGVGIGNAMSAHLASMWTGMNRRVFLSTGHPAVIAGALHSKVWQLTRPPSRSKPEGGRAGEYSAKSRSIRRLTASLEYCGPSMSLLDARRQFNQWRQRA